MPTDPGERIAMVGFLACMAITVVLMLSVMVRFLWAFSGGD